MTSWAVPGAKCVCISQGDWWKGYRLPEPGRIYTIVVAVMVKEGLGLLLEEIGEQLNNDGLIVVFPVTHFRPLLPRKTDISQFKAMLTPSKEQVPA